MEIGVLYDRHDILAICKPAGMCSQGPGTGTAEVWEVARERHPGSSIVHRIDKMTTGINLVGITRAARGYMMLNWHQITRKVYLAIISSPEWHTKTVSVPLDGKTAVTSFRVLERSGDFALVRCELVQNGRTHQIRRHLKSVGSPIVGDRKYGGSPTSVRAGQLLHAWRMEFRRPKRDGSFGGWVRVKAPIPSDFRTFSFNWRHWDRGANQIRESWEVPMNPRRRSRAKAPVKKRTNDRGPKMVGTLTWSGLHSLIPALTGKVRQRVLGIEHGGGMNRLVRIHHLLLAERIIESASSQLSAA